VENESAGLSAHSKDRLKGEFDRSGGQVQGVQVILPERRGRDDQIMGAGFDSVDEAVGHLLRCEFFIDLGLDVRAERFPDDFQLDFAETLAGLGGCANGTNDFDFLAMDSF